MRLFTIILMFVITVPISSNAQEKQSPITQKTSLKDSVVSKDSTIWSLERRFFYYIGGIHDEYTFLIDGTDTLYNGLTYKRIKISHHHAPGTTTDTIYPTEFFGGLRESDKKIFMWETWGTTDTAVKLVFDFNNVDFNDKVNTNVLTGGRKSLFGHLIIGTNKDLVESEFSKYYQLQDPSVTNSKIWNHFTDIWFISSDPSNFQFYFFFCP